MYINSRSASLATQVSELQDLAKLILDLQLERAAVGKNTYIAVKTGETEDLTEIFATTDATLQKVIPFLSLTLCIVDECIPILPTSMYTLVLYNSCQLTGLLARPNLLCVNFSASVTLSDYLEEIWNGQDLHFQA